MTDKKTDEILKEGLSPDERFILSGSFVSHSRRSKIFQAVATRLAAKLKEAVNREYFAIDQYSESHETSIELQKQNKTLKERVEDLKMENLELKLEIEGIRLQNKHSQIRNHRKGNQRILCHDCEAPIESVFTVDGSSVFCPKCSNSKRTLDSEKQSEEENLKRLLKECLDVMDNPHDADLKLEIMGVL